MLPQLREMHIAYEDSTIRICVQDGGIETIELSCRGSVKIVARQIDTHLDVSVRFTGEEPHEIPQAVTDALIGGAPGNP